MGGNGSNEQTLLLLLLLLLVVGEVKPVHVCPAATLLGEDVGHM